MRERNRERTQDIVRDSASVLTSERRRGRRKWEEKKGKREKEYRVAKTHRIP